MKLLIVDDHVAMRRLIGRVVSDMVNEIEECGDGAEALDAYHRCLPDWVLMDIEMDQTDGITATREEACGYVLKENLLAIRELLESCNG